LVFGETLYVASVIGVRPTHRSALRIVILRKKWIYNVIKLVVVENCLHGNLLFRSGTGTFLLSHGSC